VEGLHGRLHRTESADHEDGDPLPPTPEHLHHLDPVHPGHAEVEEDEIESPGLEGVHPLLAAGRLHHPVSLFPEEGGGRHTEGLVVVY
jgi:hypothetical protein